ncbi:hypothetical protein C2G38_2207030 [Gigaspora rosea]|uniref:Uncharacterized protein n=1 Tax=Gigaspora rosea TaxID=44941 RepID=A0A397ULI4_9GLOM|nr:hypothetical protein C2G38_2207030 [Gigaspora rosea]
MVYNYDGSSTVLGPIDLWDPALKIALIITKVLSNNNADIPYALIYFVDSKSNSCFGCSIAHLIATTFDYDDKTGWKFPDYLPKTLKIIDLAKDANKIYNTYIELK